MVERTSGRPLKTRKIYCLGGMGTSVKFSVHNNSLRNLRRGLIERVFFVENEEKLLEPAPKPFDNVFDELLPFRRKLHAIVGNHSPVSPQKFVEFYSGRKRNIYEQACLSLEGMPVQRRDSYLKTFVKAEKINISKKPDPAPRVIQPRNVRYNVEVGRYLRRFEHYLYRGIDEVWGGPTVIKGYTVEAIGGIISDCWNQFVAPVAIGFDMKRFDQHVSKTALQWEHSVYLDAFANDQYLAELLTWQIDNRGVGYAHDGSIKYRVEGCRMSGDMNTAMGNCLLSCAIVHQFFKEQGIKGRLINNGDDCVVFVEKECAAAVRAGMVRHWRKFGFQCELECDADIIERVEFCQMRPVMTKDGYIMVRNPLVSLSKDCYSIGPWNGLQHAQKWVNAVGQCGMALCGELPVLQSYYQCMIRNTPNVDSKSILRDVSFASGFRELAKLGKRVVGSISEESRYSFYLAFGISPDAQTALEEDYDAHSLDWGFVPPGKPRIEPISWMLKQM
jgi:hypothetical protein